MNALAQMTWAQSGIAWLLICVCLFLMLVIMIQRGRGGGLAGAFGGAGGSSAFGAKTGDVFTWITVVVASFFVVLAVVANFVFDKSVQATPPVQVTALDDAPVDTTGDSGSPVTTTIPLTKTIPVGPVQLPATGGDAPDKQDKGNAAAPTTTGADAKTPTGTPDTPPGDSDAAKEKPTPAAPGEVNPERANPGQAAEPKSLDPAADPSNEDAGGGAEGAGTGAEDATGSDDPDSKEDGTAPQAEDSPGS